MEDDTHTDETTQDPEAAWPRTWCGSFGARVRVRVRGQEGVERNQKPRPRCSCETDWVTHIALMQDLEHFVDVVQGMYPGGPSLFGLKKKTRERERERLG